MNLEEKLDKINAEIEAGLKLKSADRLRNLINEYPNELHIWERLAELYYESGFLDAAGRYWILTEPTDSRIKKATEIYLDSVNHSGTQILQDITFRGDKSALPDYARKKLDEFEIDSKLKSKYVPTFKPKQSKKGHQNSKYKETLQSKLIGWAIGAILILIILLTIIGFITVIRWLF
ncbi:DUF6584 family protein [Fulvivirga sp.]|uniref:DUF6584 family protein n=1 Tax=Fulvivirga sp. TaxID=1931237 RepID=UPI0032EFCAA6